MSKQHGWKTILYVNGGEIFVDFSALRHMKNPNGYVPEKAEQILAAA